MHLFGGTEFIALDVLFKTTNAEAPKKHKGYPYWCPSRGLGRTVPSNLILKCVNKTKTIIIHTKITIYCSCANAL